MQTIKADRAALRRLAQGGAPRGGPRLSLGPGAALLRGRVHEICGPGRRSLAAILAGLAERAGEGGPILWIRAPGVDGRPGADGLADFFNPGRLVIAAPRRAEDAPWCAEEALRAGACGLVLAELTAPLRLTPVRRLHLAARAGAERAAEVGAPAPLALLLTPGDGGCEGVESRWFFSPEGGCDAPAAVTTGRPARLASRVAAARPDEAARVQGAAASSARPMGGACADRTASPAADLAAARTADPTSESAAPPDAGPPCDPAAGATAVRAAGAASQGAWRWTSGGPESWRLELRRARLAPPRRWHATWRAQASGPSLRLVPTGAPEDAGGFDAPPFPVGS